MGAAAEIDRPKSVINRCVIDRFCVCFVLFNYHFISLCNAYYLLNNMDHMRILCTELSSVILSKTMYGK